MRRNGSKLSDNKFEIANKKTKKKNSKLKVLLSNIKDVRYERYTIAYKIA